MRPLASPAGGLTIAVDGEQFWWRVAYRLDGAAPVETANEIRVPVGRPVTFALESPDVIHSFWIPGLAGKVDTWSWSCMALWPSPSPARVIDTPSLAPSAAG